MKVTSNKYARASPRQNADVPCTESYREFTAYEQVVRRDTINQEENINLMHEFYKFFITASLE
jgi:hypothetical protein